MDKIWYIVIHGIEEGPYSVEDLSTDGRVTLDTLAWKEGFDTWIPMREIPELRVLFEKESPEEKEEEKLKPSPTVLQDELVLDLQKDPSFFFLWLILAVIIVFYLCYLIFWS